MPPSSPSIGIRPAPFAFPCPSSLVSTPRPIASVDSGLGGPDVDSCADADDHADSYGDAGSYTDAGGDVNQADAGAYSDVTAHDSAPAGAACGQNAGAGWRARGCLLVQSASGPGDSDVEVRLDGGRLPRGMCDVGLCGTRGVLVMPDVQYDGPVLLEVRILSLNRTFAVRFGAVGGARALSTDCLRPNGLLRSIFGRTRLGRFPSVRRDSK